MEILDSPPPLWNPEVDETLVCQAVLDETHDVKTFVFAAPQPRRFAYHPGQFMTFELEIGGEIVNRCYTISASPTRPDRIAITVKRVPDGPVSNWLHDTLRPGMSLKALGPMGEFSCALHPAHKYLFLSAGSGITPLMSMTRTLHDLTAPADILFVHSARSPADLIFRGELELMAARQPGLNLAFICEDDAPGQPWSGYRGRIDLAMLNLIAPDLQSREVFVCGPSPYMAAVRDILAAAGLDMDRHHQESFDFSELVAESANPEPVLEAEAGARIYKVEFTTSRRQIECAEDRFVLEAAKAAGMRLPSSCAKGMCGTCKSKLVSGTVQMTPAGGIRQREIDQGMILICCSKPTSDLVIER
ncbi:MAG: hybrid-cluster NAD(P)-dependent oxidoreductase [Caulobacteraceae bacterium]|nr:hybrid-cluster NAD(P)-dependent oxidoreductase [Caulobacteraceae bacterium]